MAPHDEPHLHEDLSHCSGCCGCTPPGITRRDFLKASTVAMGGIAMTGLSWRSLAAAEPKAPAPPARKELVVQPILTYDSPRPRSQASWRNWGGVHGDDAAEKESARIAAELKALAGAADFPVRFLDVVKARGPADVEKALAAEADAVIFYAAGGWMNVFDAALKAGKHTIVFVRHKSGPVYLWYEIISPRYLRQHGDALAVKGMDFQDVVVDSADELTWRLRALCGLKNALGTRIVAIGGPGGWGPGGQKGPDDAREKWKMDIRTVSYKDLAPLLAAAMKDEAAMKAAEAAATAYLDDKTVKLETKKEFVTHCFVLEQVFRRLMAEADAPAITVNACMGTIMPISKTTACLTLTLLNDAGYMAFCESDFVVIPAGVLLSYISGKPPFLHNPTYPHDGTITLAHCTAPRKMDGKTLEPVRIVTHFESDYGAAPKVEMRKGQRITSIIPDFAASRWAGLTSEIIDAPFLPICRSQIDVKYACSDAKLVEAMRGFHWQSVYGDYLREVGYALKKTPIQWEQLA